MSDNNSKIVFEEKGESATPKEQYTENNNLLSQECIDLLNYRIEQEEYSSRMYHSMSMWLNDNGYLNAAKKWQEDAEDEMKHAQWAKDFLLDMGIQPKIPSLNEPPQNFEGFPEIIKMTFSHEINVTKQCNALAGHSLKYNNYLLYQLAMKYMQEQQEELGKVQNYMDKLKTFGEDKMAMRFLDLDFK